MNELNYRVLVTFSDNYGHVSEIADNMSRKLIDLGLTVDTVDLERTKQKRWPTINDFNGAILISGQNKMWTFWNKKAKKFASFHLSPFEGKNKVIGFFRSDPWAYRCLLDPVKAKEKFGKNILRSFNFIPDYYEDFGPVLDFSRKSKLKYDDRSSLKGIAKEIGKKTGLEFEYKGLNDFRDWNRIEEVCDEFAEKLQKGNSCPSCGSMMPKGVEFCTNCGNKM
ncbi:MAG: zinc-ribbon domain-containing protein [Promethearchaeota archaeon]